VAIPVLLILAVLWAAVLVPPVLRSRTESKRGGVGDYTSRLSALTNHRSSPPYTARRGGRQSLRAVPPQSSLARARTAARSGHTTTPAQKRRRHVLVILIGGALLSLGLALLVSPLLWIAHIAADVLLAVYLYLLFLVKRHGPLASAGDDFWSSTPDTRQAVALSHPRVPARPELASMPGAAKPRRSAAG
jgi:Flp pilus assembly protein TadB